MKLYLSSYRVPVEKPLFELFNKKQSHLSGAIIVNAKDGRKPAEKEQKLESLQSDLAKIGLKKTVFIDLLSFSAPSKMGRQLAKYDYLYMAGGNSFSLLSAMHKSGFDGIAEDLLDAEQVYIGESAGAVVAGPSMRGFEQVDEAPHKPPKKALSLISTIIVPHNDSSEPAYNGFAERIEQLNPDYKVQPLNDNQCWVKNDSKTKIYTAK